MAKLKVNNILYEANFAGNNPDRTWDNRHSISISMNTDHNQIKILLIDNIPWSIITEEKLEHDMSEVCLSGSITEKRKGICTIKMGKKTELEKAQEQLADAELATKILLGEAN